VCKAGPETAHTGCRRVCANFLYVFKAARHGPHAPPIGRLAAAAAVARRRPGRRPSAGADSEKPSGPPKRWTAPRAVDLGGPAAGRRRDGRAAWLPRRAVTRVGVRGGLPPAGALRPRDGRGPYAGRGGWVVARAIPPAVNPERAEQTTARAASVRTRVKVGLTWRPGRRPAPRWAGRRRTGWSYGCRGSLMSEARFPS
jgi:hypothetical protein